MEPSRVAKHGVVVVLHFYVIADGVLWNIVSEKYWFDMCRKSIFIISVSTYFYPFWYRQVAKYYMLCCTTIVTFSYHMQ